MGFMLMYEFIIQKKAKKFIDKLSKNDRAKVVNAIEKLPYEGDIKQLKGYDNLMRLRVGKYIINIKYLSI